MGRWRGAGGVALALGLSVAGTGAAAERWDLGAGVAARLHTSEGANAGVLLSLLQRRDAEIKALKEQLDERDDGRFYAEASSLGVVAAVNRSALTDRQKRSVSVAIVREARRNGLDPLLVLAVIQTESSCDVYATSKVGALGLMQVMPETGRFLLERRGQRLTRPTNLFDHELNVELGTAYLAELIAHFGTVEHALVAYNAGPGAARKILGQRDARLRFVAGYPRDVLRRFAALRSEVERVQASRLAKVGDGSGAFPGAR